MGFRVRASPVVDGSSPDFKARSPLEQNQTVCQRQRFSQVRFGSQVDLIVPLSARFDFDTVAEIGVHVKAGIDPIIKVTEKMELHEKGNHMKTANKTAPTTILMPVETSPKMREHRRPQLTPDSPWENPTQIERPAFLFYSAKGGRKHPDQIPALRLATRLKRLRNTLRPTPHVQLAMKGMDLYAKLEYANPVGSIKDRAAYWILTRAAERGEICDETTVIESSSGNFAAALAAYTHLVGLRFIPVIDPNISGAYRSEEHTSELQSQSNLVCRLLLE